MYMESVTNHTLSSRLRVWFRENSQSSLLWTGNLLHCVHHSEIDRIIHHLQRKQWFDL